ncbi:MAG: Protein containing transglutaminase-like domain, putative cysteine protease, partial [uncultured Acidimicrobiales bacterium]
GDRHDVADRDPARHRVPVRATGDVVVQRGSDHPDLQRPPAGDGVRGRGVPVDRGLPLLGLVGHPGPLLRPARAARRARHHRHVDRRDERPSRPARGAGDLGRHHGRRGAGQVLGAPEPQPVRAPRRRGAGGGRGVGRFARSPRHLRRCRGAGPGTDALRAGGDNGLHHRRRRPPDRQRGVPGLHPRGPRPAAGSGHSCPLRVGVPPPLVAGRAGGGHRRPEPRLGGGVGRRMDALRRHQRQSGRRAPRGGRPGPGLLRPGAAQRDLPRRPGEGPRRQRRAHPPVL